MKDKILQHLNNDYNIAVRDPLWKNIYLSSGLREIMDHPEFQKLGRIKQLGPASLVYPGATHTRLNHSLGVFYLARIILKSILKYEDCPNLSLEGSKAFLAACMLHDLGHFPHAHSFKELPLKDHEILSSELILNSEIAELLREKVGCDPTLTAAIIDTSTPSEEGSELQFFRNILSGVLDPDKLDYLNRDAYFCGVPYGIQDIDFFLSQVRPTSKGLGLTKKGILAVENVLFSKYLMYKTVYWHRDVRISTAMVQKAVYLGLSGGIIQPEELYGMDDNQFFRRMLQTPPRIAALMTESETPKRYKIVNRIPFDSQNPLHEQLMNLDFRIKYEKHLSDKIRLQNPERLGENLLTIDIPSKISFEVDLPIIGKREEIPFIQSDSVFSKPVVRGFTDALRYIQIIVPYSTAEFYPSISLEL